MRSLLNQGAAKLARFTRRPGVRELRERALRDAEIAARGDENWRRVVPPKVMLSIDDLDARAPRAAVRIAIPRR